MTTFNFETEKRNFQMMHFQGRDFTRMIHQLYTDGSGMGERINNWHFTHLGKAIDFHEDMLKQLFATTQKMQTTMTLLEEKTHNQAKEIQYFQNLVNVLNKDIQTMKDEKQQEAKAKAEDEEYMTKMTRMVELRKELKELENDLKFHRKEN